MSIWNGPLLANIKRVFGVEGKNITEAVGNIDSFATGSYFNFIVNATLETTQQETDNDVCLVYRNTGTIVLDKTFDEIETAIHQGKNVIIKANVGSYQPAILRLTAEIEDGYIFSNGSVASETSRKYSTVTHSLWVRESSYEWETIYTMLDNVTHS